MGFLRGDQSVEDLELAEQKAQYRKKIAEAQMTEAQQIALRKEAEHRYGKGWQGMFSNFGGGIDWKALKFKLK